MGKKNKRERRIDEDLREAYLAIRKHQSIVLVKIEEIRGEYMHMCIYVYGWLPFSFRWVYMICCVCVC